MVKHIVLYPFFCVLKYYVQVKNITGNVLVFRRVSGSSIFEKVNGLFFFPTVDER